MLLLLLLFPSNAEAKLERLKLGQYLLELESIDNNSHIETYSDDYEYKEDLDGGIDEEVRGKVKCSVNTVHISSVFQMCLCGKNDVESADDAVRVVGGKEAAVDKHPWQAESPGCCCCWWCCCTCSGCWWQ